MIIITVYRIPIASDQVIYMLVMQYNQRRGEIVIVEVYQKEVFNEIIDYIRAQKLDRLVVARDLNQDITLREMKEFYSELGIRDAHQIFNYIKVTQLDNTY